MACNCDFILPTQEGWPEHYDNCRTLWHSEKPYLRNEDGTLILQNKQLASLKNDFLYHLGFDTANYDLPALFGDVKFVCMGGTKYRMREFAEHIAGAMGVQQNGYKMTNLTKHSHRYAMYKVGPVLSVNHGMGIPSMTILLQELIKLLFYAKAKDPIIFRIGTSGGLKIPPGSVVISGWGMNGCLEKSYDLPILGKTRKLPALFDKRLGQELQSLTSDSDGFSTVIGGTMAADDFYRGQARIDGPFCDHSAEEKLSFLDQLHSLGVRNIEMEATALAAMTWEAGVRCADVCVTLVNRLDGDQISVSKSTMLQWQKRPMILLEKFITKYYENKI